MKKLFSIMLLVVVLFFIVQIAITYFIKEYVFKYRIINGDKQFDIIENYKKEGKDFYNIKISDGDKDFYYVIDNHFNKQKKIIKNIEFVENNSDVCIFPVLIDGSGAYIECNSNDNLYTSYSYADSSVINNFKLNLETQGFKFLSNEDLNTFEKYGLTNIYINNLPNNEDFNDIIVSWQYKGIYILESDRQHDTFVLDFDKYENKLGCLIDKYYVVPSYTNNKILEFSSLYFINILNAKTEKIDLGYTLSSNTYLNGIVDGKIYYTDPSNLLQLEVNIKNKNVRLIGSSEIKAQIYDGSWKDINIYDFRSREIQFKDYSKIKDNNIVDIKKSGNNYYYYTSDGSIYQLSALSDYKKPILLLKTDGISNFNVIDNDIYYVISDTLYYFNLQNGIVTVYTDNDLKFNNKNRISIYRNYK